MNKTHTPSPEVTSSEVSSTSQAQVHERSVSDDDTTPRSPFSVLLQVEVPIPFAALAQVVRGLDSQELEGIALAKLGWGDDKNITHYIIETIAEALEAFGNAD